MKRLIWEEKEQAAALWTECFHTDEDYNRQVAFHQEYPVMEDAWGMEEDGKAVSILSLLPCHWVGNRNGQEAILRGSYVYGVCTGKQYRGRGLSRRLMAETLKMMKNRGEQFAVLMPAEKPLFDFYRGQGFQTCAALSVRELTGKEGQQLGLESSRWADQGLELVSADPSEYTALRRRLLADKADVFLWEERHAAYAKLEAQYCDGDLYLLRKDGEAVGLAACWTYPPENGEPGQYAVKELLCPQELHPGAAALLCQKAKGYPVKIFLPPWEEGAKIPYGMVYWLQEEHPQVQEGYLALTMD